MPETGGNFREPDGNTTPVVSANNRIEPVVFPYRGSEQHGVTAVGTPWLPENAGQELWDGEEAFDVHSKPLNPIPVVIVNESASEIRSWRAFRSFASPGATIAASQNPLRSKVTIRNFAPTANANDIIYIGATSNVSTIDGWPILPREMVTIETEEEVYVMCAIGQIEYAILIEVNVV